MSYGNYAPFYRTGFFNPMQTPPMPVQDNMGQYAQPYQPPVQQAPQMPQNQPMQNAAQTNNDIIWVQGEAGAKAYLIAPNNTVTLWDSENPTIYVKSADMNGVPSMRILDFTERTQNAPATAQNHVCTCSKNFVRMEVFDALKDDFNMLSAKFDDILSRLETPAVKTKSVKAKEDEE